jgi:predicted thioredoxin/glutaredoxin
LTSLEAACYIITNHIKLVASGSTSEGYNPVTVVVDEVGGLSATQRRKLDQRKRDYLTLIRETLEELQDEGKLKDINVTVIAFGLIGMIMWVARWYRPEGTLTSDQVAEDISKMILGGILLPRARSARR